MWAFFGFSFLCGFLAAVGDVLASWAYQDGRRGRR